MKKLLSVKNETADKIKKVKLEEKTKIMMS